MSDAEARRARADALADAKAHWSAASKVQAAKLALGEGDVGVVRTIASSDLVADPANPKNAILLRGARDSTYVLDAGMKLAKLFVEDCRRCVVRVRGVVVTQHAEVYGCEDVLLALDAPVATVQVDGCRGAEIAYPDKSDVGAVVHATCASLRITYPTTAAEETTEEHRNRKEDVAPAESDAPSAAAFAFASDAREALGAPFAAARHTTSHNLVTAQARADAVDAAAKSASERHGEISQYVTRLLERADASERVVTTERVVRDKDEYPTTVREMRAARRPSAAAGDASAEGGLGGSKGSETSEASETLEDTASARAEGRKARGNDAFKIGEFAQALAHYTQALDLAPAHPAALANRAACFLKLGEHEKALADAEACVEASPGFVKGWFRKGLSLHALGRHGEAVLALGEAERLDPRNAQVKEALRMAAFKARQQPRED